MDQRTMRQNIIIVSDTRCWIGLFYILIVKTETALSLIWDWLITGINTNALSKNALSKLHI